MWIIPKNLPIFHYVQDMEGLILDSQELSDQLEQSVFWRSKASQSKTWSRRLKRDCSLQLLYSQTLKSSLGHSLMEKWTSSVEASLVSHLASQEESKEIKIHDTCGHTLQKVLNSWEDLPLFSSRTFQESSQVNSKETIGQTKRGPQFCCMCLESWKGWVTKQRRAYSQRVKSVRHIKEKESLYLVSEMNSDKAGLISSMDLLSQINQISLQLGQHQEDKDSIGTNRQELRWATPTAMEEGKIGNNPNGNKGQRGLSNDPEIHKRWGTPITKDSKDAGLTKETKPMKDGTRRLNHVAQQVLDQENYSGKLNPRWVEMLMGLPIGWTMPSCLNPVIIEQMSLECSEMELCQIQQ